MKKILFVTPHLSTGGLPQYLYKKIESFIDQFEIWCIEYSNVSDDYIVQKTRIRNLISDRLITLGDDKTDLINHIESISPDIIHFEEVPDSFVDTGILDVIYKNDRGYNILVTTHSSNTNPSHLRYLADKFILVSEWSKMVFENHFKDKIPCEIWEYPIEFEKYDKSYYRKKLGFDDGYKHVLNVGLFTPGKNQGELIDIAREFDKNDFKVKFHFVGNQAENFRDYWQPLMNNLPQNCIIYGEKSNTSEYYMASDVFYFTSNFELNPLCIKEAIGYGLKIYAKKIHTYLNQYDNFIEYIDGDLVTNYKNLLNYLNPDKEIPGWFSYSKMYDLFVDDAKDGSTIVEIGSWFGRSTKYLLDRIKNSGKKINLEVIDTFKGSLNESIHQDIVNKYDNDIFQNFYDNIELCSDIVIHKNYSHDSSKLFNNCSIDYLMIDGDHSYEGVTSDINDFFYKVKPGGIISGDDYNVFDGTTKAVNDYFLGSHTLFGNNFNWMYRKPKIQIIHVSTIPKQDRTIKSIKNFEILKRYGIDIKFIQNEVYKGEIDLSKYAVQSNVSNVKPSHYGCYLGHTQAISEINKDDYDFTLILEEDAYIYTSVKEFVDILHKAIFTCQLDKSIAYVSFGSDIWIDSFEHNHLFNNCWHQILAHCYLIPNYHKDWYMEKIKTGIWDSADLWYNMIFSSGERKRLYSKDIFSKQLNGISIIDGDYKDYTNGNYGPVPEKKEDNFNWGNTSEWYRETIKKEIFQEKIYERFNKVESGDIVVDFGASIGPFIKTILHKSPSKVYSFEPCDEEYEVLVKNITGDNIIHLNYGISDVDSDNLNNGNMFSFKDTKQLIMKSMRFKTFLEKFNIEKIDFLKTDCEGGEYSIFNDENIDWILRNVKKISGEWHLNTEFDVNAKEKFRRFRDNYLVKFDNYQIYSVDGIDIKWDLWNERFIEYYNEIIIYIDNTKQKSYE